MRLIVNADPEVFTLAIRAAKWLLDQPYSQKDAIIAYGENEPTIDFYVRRNKASISVTQTRRAQ
jgi:hypothetical protein